LLICGHAIRDRLRPDLRFAAISAGTFVTTVILIWPGATFKLSFVKAYLFMAYLAVFRKAAWGSNISVRRRTIWSSVLFPFVVYAISMFLAIFRVNSDLPKYVLPLWPAIVLIAAFILGLWLARFKPASRYVAIAVIFAAMVLTTLPHIEPRLSSDPWDDSILGLLRTGGLAHKRLLVPQGTVPMVHYYFPEARFKGYVAASEIAEELRSGSFDGVIYAGNPAPFVPVGDIH